jgi:hypothetical protein
MHHNGATAGLTHVANKPQPWDKVSCMLFAHGGCCSSKYRAHWCTCKPGHWQPTAVNNAQTMLPMCRSTAGPSTNTPCAMDCRKLLWVGRGGGWGACANIHFPILLRASGVTSVTSSTAGPRSYRLRPGMAKSCPNCSCKAQHTFTTPLGGVLGGHAQWLPHSTPKVA